MQLKNLTKQILLAMLFGGILGGIFNAFFMEYNFISEFIVGDVFHVIGQIFINSLKMLVVPLVFISLVCGVAALGDIKKLGRLGGKALLFYIGTTALAITLAVSLAVIVAPGQGFDLTEATVQEFTPKESPSVAQTIINLVPDNPVEAMAEGQMLPLIVFSLLFGIAIVMAGESGKRVEQLLVVPLVFISLVCGVAALGDIKKLGRLGGKALLFYIGTTALAITLAVSLAVIVAPGQGFDLTEATVQEFTPKESPSVAQTIINLVPDNPVEAMAEGQMLPLIVFSLLFGIAIVMAGESGKRVEQQFNDYNTVIMQLVIILMKLAPTGVFCLIAKTFALQGIEVIKPLLSYFMVVTAALFIHALITYPVLLKTFSGLNIWTFLKKMRQVQVFAFSTASSNATIPVNIENTEKRLGVDNSVASFTIPLGATINMDGTAIMQGVATVFIANVYSISLSMGDYLAVILTATLASIGTAGVPGVGLIMLAMVLNQVGLPVEGIALIIGVDRLLDMMRTAVNVTGDAAGTAIIAKSEGALDQDTYNNH
jgi:Na+/H+-dicarboxylate symporter